MKSLIRNTVFYAISLFLLELVVAGVTIQGGVGTMIFGGLVLTLLFMFIKPVLSIITFPLNIITLGIFSWLVNIFLLYLLTVFIPSIKIQAFVLTGTSFAGFVIPRMSINIFFAFLISAFIVYAVTSVLAWLTR
ncbi:MAG: phage holin family protein [Candidatus Levybacteria bacterium]|nr:phage holin family protein [Candidatus Levybacteria bacterium]